MKLAQGKPLRIFIGGSQLDRWNTEEQIKKAKDLIQFIQIAAMEGELIIPPVIFDDSTCRINAEHIKKIQVKEVTILSGHCPVGEEQWYCVECNKFITNEPKNHIEPFLDLKPHVSSAHEDPLVKVYDKGGVDSWSEIEARRLGIPVELYPAGYKGWKNAVKCKSCGKEYEYPVDYKKVCVCNATFRFLKGYRFRNEEMVEVADIGYAIEAAGSCWHCDGKGIKKEEMTTYLRNLDETCPFCKGTGARSGATFVINEMKKLGKEGYIIVI